MLLNGEDRQESDTLGGEPLPYDQVVAGASTGGAAGGSAADLEEERHKDQPVRGMAVRGEVRHITADRTQIHVQAVIGGRRFTGVVREAPAPRAVVGATEVQTAVTQPSVVVVGAGMAGLAAADELHALGCKVVVVDARDRIGGRCWTDDSLEGRTVDLGAGWIHGCQGNPVAELARRADAGMHRTADQSAMYDAEGARIPDAEDEAVERCYNQLLDRVAAAEKARARAPAPQAPRGRSPCFVPRAPCSGGAAGTGQGQRG